ncbi:fructosamine kinase family protein [Olivibacter sitiensis]|uniref:fructosamine kinase family protein n=1 Tax=Olivibacter sitiensis TaxID=376470 RepID=UPI000426DAF6|nr:fructosamine kinase family protein [Olivibacter sitiensis]
MYLSEEFIQHIEWSIRQLVGVKNNKIEYAVPVSGGDINRCYQLKTREQYFFLKVNDAVTLPLLFLHEKEGLSLLSGAGQGELGEVCVPTCYSTGKYGDDSFLLMEWLVQGDKSDVAMRRLGEMLATVHSKHDTTFGLDYDNYFGSSVQSNKRHDDWTEFFVAERLEPQVKRAFDKGLLDNFDLQDFSILYYKLDNLYPKEKPSLVHGDFWGGNYLITDQTVPYLIDPAVYYGHREVDLALSTLFGGFCEAFYEAYDSSFPIDKDWRKRSNLWNLYPLLFHLNTFGASYRGQVRTCLNTYI